MAGNQAAAGLSVTGKVAAILEAFAADRPARVTAPYRDAFTWAGLQPPRRVVLPPTPGECSVSRGLHRSRGRPRRRT